MNAVASPPISLGSQDPESIRKWLTELTDFTPEQIEDIIAQMKEAPAAAIAK